MLRTALAALLLSAVPALAQEVRIDDPYAITPFPGATTGAAYMRIHNGSERADRLVAVASPAAERVVLHTSVEEDGVMRMYAVEEGLEIAPGDDLRLDRGGAHVMFMGLTDAWADGDRIPLTLTFEQAGEVAVEVPVDLVRLAGTDAGDTDDHGGTDHSGHGATGG